MGRCHPQDDVVVTVANALIIRIRKIQALGELYGADHGRPIRKLEGFENLWESRVQHPTGWYRQFFRFVSINGQAAAVFVDGVTKKGRNLPRHVLEAADRRLDAYLSELRADPAVQQRDTAQ